MAGKSENVNYFKTILITTLLVLAPVEAQKSTVRWLWDGCKEQIAYAGYLAGARLAPETLRGWLVKRHFPDFPTPFDEDSPRLNLSRTGITGLELVHLADQLKTRKNFVLRDNPWLTTNDVIRALSEHSAVNEIDIIRIYDGRRMLRRAPDSLRSSVRKLRLSGVNGWDLSYALQFPKLDLLDIHDSRIRKFPSVRISSGVSLAQLRRFLVEPPPGLKKLVLPVMLTEEMVELYEIGEAKGIEVGSLPVYRYITYPKGDDILYDGDTIYVHLWGTHSDFGVFKEIRIKGIDTAELRGKGRSARVEAMAIAARARALELLRDRDQISVVDIETETKYKRLLAHVLIGKEKLSDILLRENLARPYEGDSREDIDWNPFFVKIEKRNLRRLLETSERGRELIPVLEKARDL